MPPSRSSTIATGVSPRRSSGRPTTAAPCTAGWLSSAARTSSGITLKPPRMMAWSARPRIHRKPSASMRAMSVVRIQSAAGPSWPGLTSSRPGSIRAERVCRRRRPPAAARPGLAPPDAAALGPPVLLVVGQRPAGHAAAEFRCGIGRQHGDAELLGEGVGVVGGQRRGTRRDRANAVEVVAGAGRSAAPSAVRRAPATPPWADACARRRPTGRGRTAASRTNGLASATHCSTRNTPPMCTSGAFTIATPRRSSVGAGAGPAASRCAPACRR